ncbi:protein ABIL2 isoform X4 [Arachis hypogaea]|uniref:protein ABIL2 isoform X4 n=1 Tax=Arachis hypogaea TaxID=3818 RepID=UPI003B223D36
MGKFATSVPAVVPPPPAPVYRVSSNYDEVFMQQSLLFDDSLQDLKNLRTQLYSAAEYFELSYNNDEQKEIVIETLKDYAIKALVNTVDHLGSVTFKVNDLLDDKVSQLSQANLRLSCIQQRIRTCEAFMDHEGRTQQSLVISAPKYHKRYILPVGESMNGASLRRMKYLGCSLDDEDDWHHFRNAVRATIRETPSSTVSNKGRSPSPLQQKNSVSPHRFPLLRTGSFSSRPTTPNKTSNQSSTATTPSPSNNAKLRNASEPRKSASMRFAGEKAENREMEPSSKSKRLLKALLSRRKSKKDEMLYTYLDEY